MSSDDVEFLGSVPADQRIDEIHVWVAVYADGSEGIASADMPMGGSAGVMTRHMPLMNSRRRVAESLGDWAADIHRKALAHGERVLRIELRTYRKV